MLAPLSSARCRLRGVLFLACLSLMVSCQTRDPYDISTISAAKKLPDPNSVIRCQISMGSSWKHGREYNLTITDRAQLDAIMALLINAVPVEKPANYIVNGSMTLHMGYGWSREIDVYSSQYYSVPSGGHCFYFVYDSLRLEHLLDEWYPVPAKEPEETRREVGIVPGPDGGQSNSGSSEGRK